MPATQPVSADPSIPAAAVSSSSPPPAPIDATFPSLLIFQSDGTIKSIGRDLINAYPGFPVFGMRLAQLAPHPRASAWLSYDSNSGEFLMLTIRQREW
jgi:hypothetical protein